MIFNAVWPGWENKEVGLRCQHRCPTWLIVDSSAWRERERETETKRVRGREIWRRLGSNVRRLLPYHVLSLFRAFMSLAHWLGHGMIRIGSPNRHHETQLVVCHWACRFMTLLLRAMMSRYCAKFTPLTSSSYSTWGALLRKHKVFLSVSSSSSA